MKNYFHDEYEKANVDVFVFSREKGKKHEKTVVSSLRPIA